VEKLAQSIDLSKNDAKIAFFTLLSEQLEQNLVYKKPLVGPTFIWKNLAPEEKAWFNKNIMCAYAF